MSKKPISWIELIKVKLSEEKSKGNSPSINDIMPEAKKDWAQIKAGTHPKYMQGKAQTYARKKKNSDSNKTTRKAEKKAAKSASSKSASPSKVDIQQLLAEVKLCGKCKKKVEKILEKKEMTGGYNQFYDVPPIGNSDGTLTSNNVPGNALPNAVPLPDTDAVTGYDVNMPNYAQYGGGKKGKGKDGKKQKGKGSKKQKGGCVGACIGGSNVAASAAAV